MKHESRLRGIIDEIELISQLTSTIVKDVNELKAVKKSSNKRISYALLLPIEYYMHALEEQVEAALMVGQQCSNDLLVQHIMARLSKCCNRLDHIVFGGIIQGIDMTGEEVVLTLTYSCILTHLLTHSLTHSLTHLLTHSPTHLHTHSLTYSPTYSLTYLLTYLLTHSLKGCVCAE